MNKPIQIYIWNLRALSVSVKTKALFEIFFHVKIWWGLPLPMLHLLSKFHEIQLRSFCITILTNKQTALIRLSKTSCSETNKPRYTRSLHNLSSLIQYVGCTWTSQSCTELSETTFQHFHLLITSRVGMSLTCHSMRERVYLHLCFCVGMLKCMYVCTRIPTWQNFSQS